MGLIAAWKRLFPVSGTSLFTETRVADLVRQDRTLLEQALAGIPFELVDVDTTQCLIVTERFTVAICWWWREQWICAEVRIHEPYNHPLADQLHLEFSIRALLKAQGLPAPPLRSGPKTGALLRDELALVHQAVTQILCDGRMLREALFYLDGELEGYNDVAVVPEDLPPRVVLNWTEDQIRRRAPG